MSPRVRDFLIRYRHGLVFFILAMFGALAGGAAMTWARRSGLSESDVKQLGHGVTLSAWVVPVVLTLLWSAHVTRRRRARGQCERCGGALEGAERCARCGKEVRR